MAVTFKGNGLVFIPERGRYIRFVNGEYSTVDADEIAVLAKAYEHSAIGDEIKATQEPPEEIKPRRGRPKNA